VVLAVVKKSSVDPQRLRNIGKSLDEQPLLPPIHLNLLHWVAGYYHHPIGEVIFSALPALLRKGSPARIRNEQRWQLTPSGMAIDPRSLVRAFRQASLLSCLGQHSEGLTSKELSDQMVGWRTPARALMEKGWVAAVDLPCIPESDKEVGTDLVLSDAQTRAVDAIAGAGQNFQPFLLEGVTGSGKTEVYLRLIERIIANGLQALILLPEIGLTPQMVNRFRQRIKAPVAVFHSGLTDRERLCTWLMSREGRAGVVIGTRSAVFAPLK
ncbi:MAG: DEAD/DEAH box helicase, partial [Gammaproteobacteria bacterium]|nr:DEAD/DEAH box helicase [Gammaproteobacteria bacterium]